LTGRILRQPGKCSLLDDHIHHIPSDYNCDFFKLGYFLDR